VEKGDLRDLLPFEMLQVIDDVLKTSKFALSLPNVFLNSLRDFFRDNVYLPISRLREEFGLPACLNSNEAEGSPQYGEITRCKLYLS
jgi:hypothetical protein